MSEVERTVIRFNLYNSFDKSSRCQKMILFYYPSPENIFFLTFQELSGQIQQMCFQRKIFHFVVFWTILPSMVSVKGSGFQPHSQEIHFYYTIYYFIYLKDFMFLFSFYSRKQDWLFNALSGQIHQITNRLYFFFFSRKWNQAFRANSVLRKCQIMGFF